MLSVALPRVLIQISAHFMIRYYLLALDTNLMCEKCPSNQIKLWPTINLSFLMNEAKRSKCIIKQSLRTALKCLLFCVRLKFFWKPLVVSAGLLQTLFVLFYKRLCL